MKKLLRRFYFLAGLFVHLISYADTLTIVNEESKFDLCENFEIAVIKSGQHHSRTQHLLLETVNNTNWLKGVRPGHGFFGQNEIWYKGIIDNRTNSSVYIDVIQGFMDTVEYFVTDSAGQTQFYVSGTLMPYQIRQTLSGYNTLKLPPGIWKIKVRTRARYFDNAPIFIFGEREFQYFNDCRHLGWGIFYGLIIFLVIYLTYIYFKMKDIINLYFVLWVIAIGLVSAYTSGILFQYIWPQLWEINQYRSIILVLLISSLIFSNQFLISKFNPGVKSKYIIFIILLAIPGIFIDGLGYHEIAFMFIMGIFVTGNIYVIWSSYRCIQKGFKPAKKLLWGTFFFVLSFFTYLSPYEWWGENLTLLFDPWLIPAALGLFIHCFALPDRYAFEHDIINSEVQNSLENSHKKEIAFTQQYKSLEKQVIERTLELRKINEDLIRQKESLLKLNETKDKFFAIVSHDLRGPVANLYQLASLMENGEFRNEDMVGMLKTSASFTLNLLDNLLTWARSQSGELRTLPVRTNLRDLIMDIALFFKSTAEGKNIKITPHFDTQAEAFCDVNMIQAVLRNLISNAIKFTPSGGEIEIQVREKSDGFIEISVVDNGIGLTEEDVQKLFHVRRHVSTLGTSGENGTGLGLLLCKEFVEKNGGYIHVSSIKNQGSSFSFTLKIFKVK